jgi:5-methylcytosine-specific restriction endonuclease McrA
MHVDHILPRSKFPELELDIDNLQVLCEECNLAKSNIDTTDWRSVKSD